MKNTAILLSIFCVALLLASAFCSETKTSTKACLNKCKESNKEADYSRAICKINCLLPEDEEDEEEEKPKPKPKKDIHKNEQAKPLPQKIQKKKQIPRKIYKNESEMWKSIAEKKKGFDKTKKVEKIVEKKTGQKITKSSTDKQFLAKIFSKVQKNVKKFMNNKQSIVDAGKQKVQEFIKKMTGKDVKLSDELFIHDLKRHPIHFKGIVTIQEEKQQKPIKPIQVIKPPTKNGNSGIVPPHILQKIQQNKATVKSDSEIPMKIETIELESEVLPPIFNSIQRKGIKIVNDYRAKINNVFKNLGVNYKLTDAEFEMACDGMCKMEKKSVDRVACRAACLMSKKN